jgi:hypothetical protein
MITPTFACADESPRNVFEIKVFCRDCPDGRIDGVLHKTLRCNKEFLTTIR